MAILKIVRYPSKILREPTKEVMQEMEWAELTRLLTDMEDTLESTPNGLALAANQVSVPYSLLVFRQDEDAKLGIPPWVANPKIESTEGEQKALSEGCLSFPNFSRNKQRWETVEVSFIEINGTLVERIPRREKFSGRAAQVWQHEIEHLEGKTFVDDWSKKDRERLAMELGRRR